MTLLSGTTTRKEKNASKRILIQMERMGRKPSSLATRLFAVPGSNHAFSRPHHYVVAERIAPDGFARVVLREKSNVRGSFFFFKKKTAHGVPTKEDRTFVHFDLQVMQKHLRDALSTKIPAIQIFMSKCLETHVFGTDKMPTITSSTRARKKHLSPYQHRFAT